MKNLIGLLFVFVAIQSHAQNYFQAETDLMDPATAKGASLYITYGINKHAVTLGSSINQLPDMLNDQKDDFTEKRNFQLTIEYDYFFKETATGLYIGANTNYSNITIEELATNQTADLDVIRAGIVFGYVWMPWKGLVINPFANPRFSFGFDDQTFESGQTYSGETFAPFGGCKVGWRL